MTRPSLLLQVRCARCATRAVCGPEEMLTRLRQAGLLRREKDPAPDLVRELFLASGPRLTCGRCGQAGVITGPVAEAFENGDWDDEVGEVVRACEQCRTPIPAERLELFPDARLCVACQRAAETQPDRGATEYCPRCGGVMSLRAGHRGVTKYQLVCPECGHR